MGYNVIWIDDEWDTRGKPFIQLCEVKHKIHITPFKTRKEGMDLLLKDERPWDAIILDAKAFNESENETANLKGLYEAIKQIEGLKMKKSIPYFVLTGQPDLMDNDTFKELIGSFYKKDIEGQNQLITDLKEKVDTSSRHRVREMYKDAVDALALVDPNACESVLDIMEVMHFPASNPKFNYDETFNSLRKILECTYKETNKWQILPDECVSRGEDKTNINQCIQYLSGRNAEIVGVRYGNVSDYIVPRHIKDLMFSAQNLTNYLSHVYAKKHVVKPRDLLFSLALQICEIVLWLYNYIKSHQKIDENRKKCKTIGIVEKVEDNNSICVIKSKRKGRESNICLSAQKYKNLIGQSVVVLEESNNTNTGTNKQYPYFATKLQSLEKENGSK